MPFTPHQPRAKSLLKSHRRRVRSFAVDAKAATPDVQYHKRADALLACLESALEEGLSSLPDLDIESSVSWFAYLTLIRRF